MSLAPKNEQLVIKNSEKTIRHEINFFIFSSICLKIKSLLETFDNLTTDHTFISVYSLLSGNSCGYATWIPSIGYNPPKYVKSGYSSSDFFNIYK